MKLGASSKVEVGVLTNQKPPEPEDLSLGGFLTVIGKDTEPSISPNFALFTSTHRSYLSEPTRFSFPSRHHLSPQDSGTAYHSSFLTPTGLHPSLRLTFPSASMRAPSPDCTLHTYLTLPSILFADKYQLSSPLFLASKNLRALRSVAGETDLEAPDWVVSKWGSTILMELAPPAATDTKRSPGSWNAEIPLHLRYLPPSSGGKTMLSIPWPTVFWACHAEKGTKMSVNPFDRVNLGYDGLFGPRTIFYHLQPDIPAGSMLTESMEVPVLDSRHVAWVENGTVAAVLIAVVWVMVRLWAALQLSERNQRSRSGAVVETGAPMRQKQE